MFVGCLGFFSDPPHVYMHTLQYNLALIVTKLILAISMLAVEMCPNLETWRLLVENAKRQLAFYPVHGTLFLIVPVSYSLTKHKYLMEIQALYIISFTNVLLQKENKRGKTQLQISTKTLFPFVWGFFFFPSLCLLPFPSPPQTLTGIFIESWRCYHKT